MGPYTHRGVRALASLITLKNVPLIKLHIRCADNFLSLKALIENFSSPTAGDCCALELLNSGLTSRHAYHLILLLTQARKLQKLDLSYNPGLLGTIPLLLSAARKLKWLSLTDMIDDQELLEMAPVLQSNTSLTHLEIFSVVSQDFRNSKESLIKFVEIITAPKSKSRLEEIIVGHRLDNEDIVTRLPAELANMALSRGHSLKITHLRGVFSSVSQSDSDFAPLASMM